MNMKIKQYVYEKTEVASKEIQLPIETSYFFETDIRRSIKIIPRFTTCNKELYDKEEELYELEVVCVYGFFECKVEKFKIRVSDIEDIYYSEKHRYKAFITALIDDWFQKRTKEQFEADLNSIFSEIRETI